MSCLGPFSSDQWMLCPSESHAVSYSEQGERARPKLGTCFTCGARRAGGQPLLPGPFTALQASAGAGLTMWSHPSQHSAALAASAHETWGPSEGTWTK